MTVEIIRGATTKPAATDELVRFFSGATDLDGQLILGFPNLGGQADDATPDALWLSQEYGPVLFDLVEGTEVGNFERRQEDLFRLFQARLFQNRALVQRRKLLVEPKVVTFAPGTSIARFEDEVIAANASNMREAIKALGHQELDEELFQHLLSSAQTISSIRRARQTRVVAKEDSRGAKLLQLESSIATLDNRQHHAVIETIDGVQRIRGLAGSGKTIILALKAAYLHGRHPDWRIAVTFYTRALKEQFRQLITTFCVEQSGVEPDWDRIHIINAWGGRGGPERTGIYKQFCDANDATYYDFQAAANEFGKGDAFTKIVRAALDETSSSKKIYDVILVDEAQDFPPEFLRMCYLMLGEERRLVYAYDELQSLTGAGLPDPGAIFGLTADGEPLVSFEPSSYDLGARRDIVLEKCYRNSRPVLVSAHGIGFGTARKARSVDEIGLVQMFDQPKLWRDIGYHVAGGDLLPGHPVTLARSPESSPQFLEAHSPQDDLIQFKVFDSQAEQYEWVASEIERNLTEDELRHDDIMVINPNPFTARSNLGPLRKGLIDRNIANHLAGVDLSADIFFAPEHESITFTGINRAKGNEAGMVYVVNAHEGNDERRNLAVVRNRLFTAITRSKAWVRICGVGPEMESLAEEFEAVKKAKFQLSFDYPTDEQRDLLRIVHREVSKVEDEQIVEAGTAFRQFIDGVRSGQLYREDLPKDLLDELKDLLDREENG
ncbi:DEAD/DEAH box helicase [Leucobacter sp. VD1]|uniref:DEAD/DEAH box helicase n=1 Tax=Leucobacter sp. VD1 TaxID=3080381 RepID=UPI003015AF99